MNRLGTIASVFGFTSVLSFGGTNAVLPHLHTEAVSVHGWMSERDFVECFAIAQVTPGPSTTVATLLGYQAGGIAGAAVATLAMIVPSCVLVFLVARIWQGSGDALWHRVMEKGLGPVGLGVDYLELLKDGIGLGDSFWGRHLATLVSRKPSRWSFLLIVCWVGNSASV